MKLGMKAAVAACCLGLSGALALPGEALSQEVKYEEATPSHVYQATSDLISEIEILREEMGITVYPVEAELQEDRAPVHVYAKSLEVLEKISAAQRRLGIDPARIGQIPVKDIIPGDVYRSVQNSLAEVRRIKEELVIEEEIRPAPLEGGKTPTYVYQHLGDASFLLDGLVGHPVDPNDVYNHIMFLHDEMELIAAKLKVALDLDAPVVDQRKRMKAVAQQVLRATFKIINLQTRLGMDASGVPQITLVRVSPAEVYEATNVLLAEMVRIKAHLDIQLPREEHAMARNKRPRDVFSQVLRLIRNLDILAKAAVDYQAT
ncbi:MAG: hypothetical protein OXO52_17685 [Rhodospirillales bacterium]|nr:hypothetical protein [Rhodospirillales bacterium]MDE0382037.1 hypothetical protein [Rhodospirillales bacterium]